MPRPLSAGAAWLALGAGAAGLELAWPPLRRRHPGLPQPDPSAPLGTELAEELASVEHEGYFCTGVWGVDRKKITGSQAESSAQACAAGVERDPECGQELYFGVSRAGEWQCRCVLAGRSCLRERAPQGALFTVFRFGAAGGLQLGEHRAAPRHGAGGEVTPEHSHSVLGELTVPAAGEQLEAGLDPGALVASVPPATAAPWADVRAAPTPPPAERTEASEDTAPERPRLVPPRSVAPERKTSGPAASTLIEPLPAAAAGIDASREGQREKGSCAPAGYVRRFLSEPPGGWHLQGQRESFAACAAAGRDGGFVNVAWNSGSSYFGDCYAIKDEMPSLNFGDCADYCWVYGAACKQVLSDTEAAPSTTTDLLSGLLPELSGLLPDGLLPEQAADQAQAQTTAQLQPLPVPTEQRQPQLPGQPQPDAQPRPQDQPQPETQLQPAASPQASAQSGAQPTAQPQPEAHLQTEAQPQPDAQPNAQMQTKPQQPPPEVVTLPQQSQPPPRELVGTPGGGFCVGQPLYDGPTMGWEDCRTRCDVVGCRFWSYWHNSVQHWCKLTVQCAGRKQDGRHTISAYQRAQDAAGEGADQAAWDDGPASSTQEPQEPQAGGEEAASAEHSEGQPSPAHEDVKISDGYPKLPGCYMRMPSGCPNHVMRSQVWRHDVRAEQNNLTAAQCQLRKSEWDDYCGVGDVEMAFVAISQTKAVRMDAAAPEQEEADDQQAGAPDSEQTCSPLGAARKFARSPQGGWHDLGRVGSYVDCAHAAWSMGYRNLVWNNGSAAKGRCYGFANDVPDPLQRGCESTYCWLFGGVCHRRGEWVGRASEVAGGQDAEGSQNLIGRSLTDGKMADAARAEVKGFVEAGEDEARAIEDAEAQEAARARPGGSPRTPEEQLEAWGEAALEARGASPGLAGESAERRRVAPRRTLREVLHLGSSTDSAQESGQRASHQGVLRDAIYAESQQLAQGQSTAVPLQEALRKAAASAEAEAMANAEFEREAGYSHLAGFAADRKARAVPRFVAARGAGE